MAKRNDWPDSWPSIAFFGIGGVVGFISSFLVCLFLPLSLAAVFFIASGFGIIFGFLGVVFREDVLFLLPPWNWNG